MALKNFVPGRIGLPADLLYDQPIAGSAIDATGEAIACIWRSPLAGDITQVQFRLSTVTTGDVISVEIQTVATADGLPTGTLWGTGTGISFSLTTTMANTWQTAILSAKATVAFGDTMAIVVKRNDTGGAGNFQVTMGNSLRPKPIYAVAVNVLAAWSKLTSNTACIIPNYSETAAVAALGQFLPGTQGEFSLSAAGANDEVGNTFVLPFRARASGWWFGATTMTSAAVIKVRLYNTDGSTVMAERVLDSDQIRAGANVSQYFTGVFQSATVLAADSTYRLALFVSVGVASIVNFSVANVTAMNCLNLGSLCAATVRADAGVWSNDTGLRYQCGIIIDQLDDSSASGGAAGGLAHIIGSQ